MPTLKTYRVAFYLRSLAEINNYVESVYTKLSHKMYDPLTTEEMFILREGLVQYRAVTSLLKDELTTPTPPKPWYKRRLRFI